MRQAQVVRSSQVSTRQTNCDGERELGWEPVGHVQIMPRRRPEQTWTLALWDGCHVLLASALIIGGGTSRT